MNINAKHVMGSIVGLALLLGGSFASPASAKISVQQAGNMNTGGGPGRPAYMTKRGLTSLGSFLNQKLTDNKQADIWGQPKTIIPTQNPNNSALSNFRLDIQNPPPGYTNLQVQEGGGTFATVLVPRTLANLSTNSTSRAAQVKELMRAVRNALYLSGKSTVRDAGFTYQPKIYKLTGSYSN
jgi:hypothetical protein